MDIPKTARRLLTILAGAGTAILLVGIAFYAGYDSRGRVLASAQTEQFPLLKQAQDYIDQYYIRDQPPQQQLEYGAIRGLITTLNDKYTFFVEPPVAQSESNVLAGTYGGIGVLLKRDESNQFVLYPFRDSPAAKAGVQDSDVLLSVNSKDVPLTTQQDAVDQMLRGEVKADSGVTIHVRHQPSGKEETFTIPFAVIDVPSVVWRTLTEEPSFGYIAILRFTNRTPDELKTAITELKSKSVTGLILDLRNNPGGLLDESLKVAGAFLNGGLIFIEKDRASEKPFNAPDNSFLTDLPMIVLINGGTASAAELVAGAIHDRGRGILLGQQSYGKGSVQLILPMADKSSIHITTAEWLPPNHGKLDGKGLTPDIPMIPDQNGRDVELGEAIRQLRTRK